MDCLGIAEAAFQWRHVSQLAVDKRFGDIAAKGAGDAFLTPGRAHQPVAINSHCRTAVGAVTMAD
jgi:hypothetical protein